jgi:hypothetical protein
MSTILGNFNFKMPVSPVLYGMVESGKYWRKKKFKILMNSNIVIKYFRRKNGGKNWRFLLRTLVSIDA